MTKLRENTGLDVLMIDDIQFIIGKESTQEDFFSIPLTCCIPQANRSYCPLISRQKKWKTLEERFRSRFDWGLIAGTSSHLTMKPEWRSCAKTQRHVINPSMMIFKYIATNIKSNIRNWRALLTELLPNQD